MGIGTRMTSLGFMGRALQSQGCPTFLGQGKMDDDKVLQSMWLGVLALLLAIILGFLIDIALLNFAMK